MFKKRTNKGTHPKARQFDNKLQSVFLKGVINGLSNTEILKTIDISNDVFYAKLHDDNEFLEKYNDAKAIRAEGLLDLCESAIKKLLVGYTVVEVESRYKVNKAGEKTIHSEIWREKHIPISSSVVCQLLNKTMDRGGVKDVIVWNETKTYESPQPGPELINEKSEQSNFLLNTDNR